MRKRYATKWVVLRGDGTNYPRIEQDVEDYFDCSGVQTGQLELCLSQMVNCTLTIEGAEQGSNYFTKNLAVTDLSSTVHVLYLNRGKPRGDSERLCDVVRWTVEGTTDWEACFRLVLGLK